MKFVLAVFVLIQFAGGMVSYAATLSEKPRITKVIVENGSNVKISIAKYREYNNYYHSNVNPYGYYYYNEDDGCYYNEYTYDNDITGAELLRSDSMNGTYYSIGSASLTDTIIYSGVLCDSTALEGYTYYYKVRYYRRNNDMTYDYGEESDAIMVNVISSPGEIKYVRATKNKTFTIKWNPVANVDGYEIYMKEFPNEYATYFHNYASYEMEGIENGSDGYALDKVKDYPYKLVKTVNGSATSSVKYTKAKHGYGYLFAIRTFKVVNNRKVTSNIMFVGHGIMDYYYCENAENTKYDFVWPTSQKKAEKLCTTIKVKMWDFKNHAAHKGAKRTRIQYITVNKKYAATIKQIFKEIYKSKKKPPIYEAGSYRWRPEESTWSYHTVGTAIDMNCNENPMYSYDANGKKKVAVGSFYKPKSNPYSMPRNGVIEKTFKKYGFARLDHDLMHFNAYGVSSSTNY